jgi:hypothetical protein
VAKKKRTPNKAKQGEQATFVFQGTVIRTGASAMREVKESSRTAVVRVDKLIRAPESLADYAGQEVTVQLASGEKVAQNQTLVFHTRGLVFGEGLAVQSIRLEEPSPAGIAALSGVTGDAVRNLHARAAIQEVSSADLVVSGHVTSVRLPAAEGRARATAVAAGQTSERISEHAPLWQEAVIEIDQVHKGAPANKKQVVVRFPSSTDVRWRHAPKFHAGQEGVFILQKPAAPPAGVAALAAAPGGQVVYSALHPADFQPLENLHQILAAGSP